MSAIPVRLLGPGGGVHPVVRSRRIRAFALTGAAALIPLAIALAISIATPDPDLALLLGLFLGGLAIVYLVVNPRLEVSVMLVALYLGLLGGPVKLGIGGHESGSAVRDVLIAAVCAGAIARLLVKREPISMPPLSGWVCAWVAIVLTEALNPHTAGLTKSIGGFRQLLEWVPFFFFGYAIMRSKARFRRLFIVLGAIAVANAVVGTYQTRLTPQELAAWGPGYAEITLGVKGLSARTFVSEGVARVRPPALGTDEGDGGDVGLVALPAAMALLALGGLRRRWWMLLCFAAALVAIATCAGRSQVIGAVLAALAFVALSFGALAASGRHALRPLLTLLCVILLALPVGAVFVSALGGSAFARYKSILTGQNSDNKQVSLKHIPAELSKSPFGVGLGVAGGAASFGNSGTASAGSSGESQESHNPDAETQYNFLADETGVPGLLLWVGLSATLIYRVFTGLRRVRDVELLLGIAAMFSAFLAITAIGFYGPTLTDAVFGPFFWFFAGTVSYWFLGPGRAALSAGGDAHADTGMPAGAGVLA
ncbi:MAG TPA: hypothetical protein VMF09_11055 [Solirubrobacteraceae bacterium]|nr:hypothetical protein [Solirubrobacteraceae bacterium]